MKIDARQRDGVAVLTPDGKTTIGATEIGLRDAVLEVLETGTLNVLVDLSQISKVDSSRVGEMVHAYTTLSNREGKLKLLSPQPPVLEVLQLTGLDAVFQIYDDEDEAIASF